MGLPSAPRRWHMWWMRVSCPACRTEYDVPAEARGRKLRCANCGHQFRAGGDPPRPPPPERPRPAPPPPEAQTPAAPRAEQAPRRAEALAAAPASSGGSAIAPRLGWVASIAVLALAGIALHLFRAEIVEAWPPMLRLYAALGLS